MSIINLSYDDRIIEQYNTEIMELEEKLSQLTFDPEYDGIIVFKYIKCGKKGCRCMLDTNKRVLHGPYPHFQYRKNKILHQKYLNRKNYKEFSSKVNANNEYKKIKSLIRKFKRAKKDYIKKMNLMRREDGV